MIIWSSFANYIEQYVLLSYMLWLAMYLFAEQHTGDNIVEKKKEVISEDKIDDNSIFAIFTIKSPLSNNRN